MRDKPDVMEILKRKSFCSRKRSFSGDALLCAADSPERGQQFLETLSRKPVFENFSQPAIFGHSLDGRQGWMTALHPNDDVARSDSRAAP